MQSQYSLKSPNSITSFSNKQYSNEQKTVYFSHNKASASSIQQTNLENQPIKEIQQEKNNINQSITYINQQSKVLNSINQQSYELTKQMLSKEIESVTQNKDMTHVGKQYSQAYYTELLLEQQKQEGEAQPIQIYHMNSLIDIKNDELMLYVLKEQLLRDRNMELFMIPKSLPNGLTSIIGAYGQDQGCFNFRTNQIDFDEFMKNETLKNQYLLNFQENVAKTYNIPQNEIEILGVTKGSVIVSYKINSKSIVNSDSHVMLEKVCGGDLCYHEYFIGVKKKQSGTLGLSREDFNPKYNMSWLKFQEKEMRGPPYHRYEYYFPVDCQGFGLNVDNKNYDSSQDWLQMNGNQNEWRILYHGTKQQYVAQIVKDNLKPGINNAFQNDYCLNQLGQRVKVGAGIYFSDKIDQCLGYTIPIQVKDKKFSVFFQSRVNPKKIRQSDAMKIHRYFVINDSNDVRPYRILLKEIK